MRRESCVAMQSWISETLVQAPLAAVILPSLSELSESAILIPSSSIASDNLMMRGIGRTLTRDVFEGGEMMLEKERIKCEL